MGAINDSGKMARFVNDEPQGMTETMLNYAYARNGRVYLRFANSKEDVELCEYIAECAKEQGCDVTPDAVMAGDCCFCDCQLGMLYVVSVQAAELRERLREYENRDGGGETVAEAIQKQPD